MYLLFWSDLHGGEVGDVHFPWSIGVHLDLMLCIPVTGAGRQEVSECLVVYFHKWSFHLVLHGKERQWISLRLPPSFDLSVFCPPAYFCPSANILGCLQSIQLTSAASYTLPSFCPPFCHLNYSSYKKSGKGRFVTSLHFWGEKIGPSCLQAVQLTSHPFSVRLDAVWNTCCTARGIIPLSSSTLPSGPSIV